MPIHDSRRTVTTKRITAFAGVHSAVKLSDSGASEMKNFRILPDGSLEKRCGFETVIQSTGAIRGYWEGSFSGTSYVFFVAGTVLYRLSQTDTAPVQLYTMSASNGRVSFFRFRDSLYVTDSYTMLRFQPETGLFVSAQGYVPLYGKNWHPAQMGEVNETRNLLCNSLRVHYANSTASQVFQLPFTASRIQSVRVNGTSISNYTFTSPSSTVTIPASYATGGEVLIAFDLDSIFSNRSTVLRAGCGAVYKDGYHETLLTYGGRSTYRVFRTAAVSDDMLAGSRQCYPASDALYFRAEDMFTLGSPEHPITAALQHLDRMLVFSDIGMWILRHPQAQSDAMEVVLYQTGIGCAVEEGAVLCRGVPVVLSPVGVGRISLVGSDSDICTMTLISDALSDRFPEAVLRHSVLHWSDRENRIWIRDTTDTGGTVWLSDPEGNCWIRYTGIDANGLIDCQGSPGFTTATGRIAKFDDALTADDGQPFEASYLSAYLDFSSPEHIKRAGYAALCANTGGAQIRLSVENDRAGYELRFTGRDTEAPEFFDGRFGTGRFRFLRYRVTVSGTARARIYVLTVSVTI